MDRFVASAYPRQIQTIGDCMHARECLPPHVPRWDTVDTATYVAALDLFVQWNEDFLTRTPSSTEQRCNDDHCLETRCAPKRLADNPEKQSSNAAPCMHDSSVESPLVGDSEQQSQSVTRRRLPDRSSAVSARQNYSNRRRTSSSTSTPTHSVVVDVDVRSSTPWLSVDKQKMKKVWWEQ
jgi:hypothetical protein